MIDPLQRLHELEAIRSLKARYFRAMDTKDWDTLAGCFTGDLVADFRQGPGMLAEGRDNYMAQLTAILADARTVHHGHMPEIELLDDSNATGIWAMEDRVELPGLSLRGFGHYHDEYARTPDGWRIRRSRLTRLRLDLERKPGGPSG